MKKRKMNLSVVFTAFGVILVCLSLLSFVLNPFYNQKNAEIANETANNIKSIIPSLKKGTINDRVNIVMPSLEYEEENFVGLIEIKRFNTFLPVTARYEKDELTKFPARYKGSVYDGSLVIIGSKNKGQFDFMKVITEGDELSLTDMEGMQYSYKISEIKLTKEFDKNMLNTDYCELVLVAQSGFFDEYTYVYCALK